MAEQAIQQAELSWGFCHPFDALPTAPPECWNLYEGTRPSGIVVMSHTPTADLERINEIVHPAEVIVRLKLGPNHQNTCPPNAFTYQEWPDSDAPTGQDTTDWWLERGVRVIVVHLNEPDTEMPPEENWTEDDWQRSFDALAHSFWITRVYLADRYGTEFGRSVQIAAAPLSQGNIERWVWWRDHMIGQWFESHVLLAHCYTNGQEYDTPEWGGQWRELRAAWPNKRIIIGETNDNGALWDDHGPEVRGQHIGGYAAHVLMQADGPDTVMVFEAPRTPGGKPWWAVDPATGDFIAAAIDLPLITELRRLPEDTGDDQEQDQELEMPEAWTDDQIIARTIESAEFHSMPARCLLGLLCAESDTRFQGGKLLDQYARRPPTPEQDEEYWTDVSFGLGQQTVRWAHEYINGDLVQSGHPPNVFPGRAEIDRIAALYFDAEHAIIEAAGQLGPKWRQYGDALEACCRYNKPSIPGSQNRNRVNYILGLAEADRILETWSSGGDTGGDQGGTDVAVPEQCIADMWEANGVEHHPTSGIEKFYAEGDNWKQLGPCVSPAEVSGEDNEEGKPCMYRMFSSGKAIRWDPLHGGSIVE